MSASLLTFTDLLHFGKKCIVQLNTRQKNDSTVRSFLVPTTVTARQLLFFFFPSFKFLIFIMMTKYGVLFPLEAMGSKAQKYYFFFKYILVDLESLVSWSLKQKHKNIINLQQEIADIQNEVLSVHSEVLSHMCKPDCSLNIVFPNSMKVSEANICLWLYLVCSVFPTLQTYSHLQNNKSSSISLQGLQVRVVWSFANKDIIFKNFPPGQMQH